MGCTRSGSTEIPRCEPIASFGWLDSRSSQLVGERTYPRYCLHPYIHANSIWWETAQENDRCHFLTPKQWTKFCPQFWPIKRCLKALLQYSVLWDLNPGLHLMQTLFYFKLEQSSQLLRIVLITTTLVSLALGHSILATYFKVQGCSSYFRRVNSDQCKIDNITVFQWSQND